MMALIGPLIGPLISAAFAALLAGLTAWIKSQNDQHLGATVEAAKVNVATVATTQAIAQAEVAAPRTLDDTIASLKAGTF